MPCLYLPFGWLDCLCRYPVHSFHTHIQSNFHPVSGSCKYVSPRIWFKCADLKIFKYVRLTFNHITDIFDWFFWLNCFKLKVCEQENLLIYPLNSLFILKVHKYQALIWLLAMQSFHFVVVVWDLELLQNWRNEATNKHYIWHSSTFLPLCRKVPDQSSEWLVQLSPDLC